MQKEFSRLNDIPPGSKRSKEVFFREISPEQKNKSQFFSNFARQFPKFLELHRQYNLMPSVKRENTKDEDGVLLVSGHPSMHCLVEAVAGDSLREPLKANLGLSDSDIDVLRDAGLYHDFYKGKEIEAKRKSIKEKKEGESDFVKTAEIDARKILLDNGVTSEVIELIGSVGHISLADMDALLKKQELSNQDKLRLIFHYIDDITVNDKIISLDEKIKALEDRSNAPEYDSRGLVANKDKSLYYELNESGRQIYGMTMFEKQKEVGQRVEGWLSEKFEIQDPKLLPEFILEQINKRIEESKKI